MKIYTKTKSTIIFLILIACFTASCQDDITTADTTIKYDLSLGLPIGKATFNLNDILTKFYSSNDTSTTIEKNGSAYSFVMKTDHAFTFRDIKFLKDGTTVSAGEMYSPADVLPAGIQAMLGGSPVAINDIPENNREVSFHSNKFINFALNSSSDERIDSAGIIHSELNIKFKKEGSMGMNITRFKIKFPMRNENTGQYVTLEIPNSDYPVAAFDTDYKFNIDNFMVNIEDEDGNPTTTGDGGFTFEVELYGKLQDGTTLTQTDKVGYDVTFTIFNHKVVYGDFKPANVKIDPAVQSFNLLRDINKGKTQGVLLFDDVQVKLKIRNYDIGVFLQLWLDSLRAYRRDDPIETRKYLYAKFDEGVNKSTSKSFTTRPLVPFSGTPSYLSFSLNKDDGRLEQLFQQDFMPDMFQYFFKVQAGLGSDGAPKFITCDSHIDCDVEFEIPINLRPGSFYVYTDTINGFKETFDEGILQYLTKAEMGLSFENGLPIGVIFQLCLHEENGDTIESELNQKKFNIDKAPTNSAGEVITDPNGKNTTVSKEFKVVLSEQTIQDLQDASYITYSVRAINENDNTSNIKFQENNRFNIQLNLFGSGSYQGDAKLLLGNAKKEEN